MDKLRISCNQMALSSNQTSGFETLLLEATRLLSTINRKEKETDSDSHLVFWCRWRHRQHSSVRAKENPRSLSVNTRQVSKCWHYILLFVCVCVWLFIMRIIWHALFSQAVACFCVRLQVIRTELVTQVTSSWAVSGTRVAERMSQSFSHWVIWFLSLIHVHLFTHSL